MLNVVITTEYMHTAWGVSLVFDLVNLMYTLLADEQIDGQKTIYCKVSNIRRTLVGNKIVDHSDVVGASPVGAAPTTSSSST